MNAIFISRKGHWKSLDPGERRIHRAEESVAKAWLLRVVPKGCITKIILGERRKDER